MKRKHRGKAAKTQGAGAASSTTRWIFGLLVVTALTLLAAEGGLRLTAFLLRRDDPFRLAAHAGGRVFYCIGDSFTYGHGVRPEEAYPKVLERLLNDGSRTRRAEVRNYGLPGSSSSVAIRGIEKVIKEGDAAVVFMLTGWNANDLDFTDHARKRSRPVPLTERVDNLLERSTLYRLTKQALTLRDRRLLLGRYELDPPTKMDSYDFRAYQEIAYENLEKIVRLCREYDVPLVLLNYPYRDLPPNPYSKNEYYHVLFSKRKPSPEEYLVKDRFPDEIAIHAVIRKLAEEERVKVIDLDEAFRRSGLTVDRLFQKDWHHPTAAGHEVMARAIMETMGEDLVRLVDAEDQSTASRTRR